MKEIEMNIFEELNFRDEHFTINVDDELKQVQKELEKTKNDIKRIMRVK
jgi:hypothetical protein